MELTRLTKKYPNGTLSRWEVIADHMNRSVQEVTFQAARLKEPTYRPSSDSVAETIVQEATKKAKKVIATIAEDKPCASEVAWSQDKQKLLENAIVKYPKTTVGDRWQKIANSVPGRTKEECLARYKYLVQKVKEQKSKDAASQQQQQENDEQVEKIESNDVNDRVEDVDKQEETTNLIDEYEPEPVPEPVVEKKTGGKPRNRRKQRKKQMDFSSDEDDHLDYE